MNIKQCMEQGGRSLF